MVGLYINRINSKVENVHHTWLFVQILHKDENEKLLFSIVLFCWDDGDLSLNHSEPFWSSGFIMTELISLCWELAVLHVGVCILFDSV
jgi:hypothetical protein